MITYQRETWPEFEPEGTLYFHEHWEEVGQDRERIPLDVDSGRYTQLEQLGNLHVLTARADGRLAGYIIFFLMHHLHYRSAGLMAVADVYYMLPEFRAIAGAQLFREAEKSLKERGVVKAYMSCKVEHDHSPLFERLGWRPMDKVFTKVL